MQIVKVHKNIRAKHLAWIDQYKENNGNTKEKATKFSVAKLIYLDPVKGCLYSDKAHVSYFSAYSFHMIFIGIPYNKNRFCLVCDRKQLLYLVGI